MQKSFMFNVGVLHISLSIGIAASSSDKKETAETLMKKADIALYEFKPAGRNGAQLYTENIKACCVIGLTRYWQYLSVDFV